MLPYAAAARAGLASRLPRMVAYAERARELADALDELDGVRVHPRPPHTNAFRVFLDAPGDAVDEAVLTTMEDDKVAVLGRTRSAEVPGWCMGELTVGDATLAWEVHDQVAAVARLLDRARSGLPS